MSFSKIIHNPNIQCGSNGYRPVSATIWLVPVHLKYTITVSLSFLSLVAPSLAGLVWRPGFQIYPRHHSSVALPSLMCNGSRNSSSLTANCVPQKMPEREEGRQVISHEVAKHLRTSTTHEMDLVHTNSQHGTGCCRKWHTAARLHSTISWASHAALPWNREPETCTLGACQ